ncbi:MAG: FAD-dependent thymidylate synthase [Acidobacteriota bacterium]|nr:FAD-dependent thymidylate synthase [Acidobacteriota bacterium]
MPKAQPAPDPAAASSVNVFAVHGVEPEVQAYAMAKYSRSALSMKESLQEISDSKAEQFLNTFYFQYGHRSIADLAHIAFAIERLSILAAIELVDEQRWDGQERSTRYQNFKKSGYYTPDFGADDAARKLYTDTADFLFTEYIGISEAMFTHLAEKTAKPAEMEQAAYDRTLKARAFDISRYLLPLATNTSLGQIVNARTLESQISRLLSHSHGEIRQLGELLREAARTPAYNVNHATWKKLIEEIRAVNHGLAQRAESELLKPVRVAPTLVKYTTPNVYDMETRKELAQAAAELMRDPAGNTLASEKVSLVDLLDDEPLDVELATTLLYGHCHYPYRQLRDQVMARPAGYWHEIIALGTKHRGKHDELLRPFSAGQAFRFDILMDIGGFRDLHRHRRCVQIEQEFTTAHGYAIPHDLIPAGLQPRFGVSMKRATETVKALAARNAPEAAESAQYLIPLAFRKRTLFKMDFAEALYIAELRTTPAGHWSYREVAYQMYEQVAKRYPALGKLFRVHDISQPVDLLQR